MDEAWAALRRAQWAAARDAFAARLRDDPGDPEALDGLGRALWWLGEHRAGVERRREAYAGYCRRGATLPAANVATYVAGEERIAGNPAAASGWLARAARLLEEAPVCAERGWFEVELAKRAAGDAAEQERRAAAAAALGRELGDAGLEACGLAQLGLAQVDRGAVDDGLALLDEAMAVAMGGEAADPFAIGDACCTVLVACDRLADFERAAEWSRAVVEFTGRRGYTPLHLWCRTIYAGVLTATGEWEQADRELEPALRGLEDLGGAKPAYAIGRLAELRVRQGRLGEAERLLAGYEDHRLALPAAVSLALARGRVELARALVERRLEAGGDEAARAVLLPLAASARLAAGDLDAAESAARELAALATRLRRDNLAALAALARGQITAARAEAAVVDDAGERRDAALADGDAVTARGHLTEALDAFRSLRMPLEAGRAQLALARLEQGELAVVHARGALATFERLGARRDADAAAALLRDLGVSGRSAPRLDGELTAREREVLALLGEGLSNRAIADRLYISPKTAEHHVGRILGKLGLRSRAEAAAHAARGQNG